MKAFATAVEQLPTGVASVLAKLFALFSSCTDASGRAGVVTALGASSNALQKHDVPLVATLLLKALSGSNPLKFARRPSMPVKWSSPLTVKLTPKHYLKCLKVILINRPIERYPKRFRITLNRARLSSWHRWQCIWIRVIQRSSKF